MNLRIASFVNGMEDGREVTGECFIKSAGGVRKKVGEGDVIILNMDTKVKYVCPRGLVMDLLKVLSNKE